MIGAIVGDIVGSRFEFNNHKSKDFELFDARCGFTDDSILTIAIADAIMMADEHYGHDHPHGLQEPTVHCLRHYGAIYPRPYGGYGSMFKRWVSSRVPLKAYDSYGNGAAMRVSPVAYAARSVDEARHYSARVTNPTHNHPEGIKGAEATTVATFMALNDVTKDGIKKYIESNYYKLDFTLDDLRETYTFDGSCQGTVPQALQCFFESTDFEDAIRNAISIGGDSDTIGAITGAVAGAYYGVPDEIRYTAELFLDRRLLGVLHEFEGRFVNNRKKVPVVEVDSKDKKKLRRKLTAPEPSALRQD